MVGYFLFLVPISAFIRRIDEIGDTPGGSWFDDDEGSIGFLM